MNKMAKGEFARLTVKEMKKLMPLIVHVEGENFAIFARPEDIIYIGDMHPRVKNFLRARERLARVGMNKQEDEKIFLSDFRKEQVE